MRDTNGIKISSYTYDIVTIASINMIKNMCSIKITFNIDHNF